MSLGFYQEDWGLQNLMPRGIILLLSTRFEAIYVSLVFIKYQLYFLRFEFVSQPLASYFNS